MTADTNGKQLSVRLNTDLESELERYCNAQKFNPTRSEVVRRAITEFLEREAEAGEYDASPDFE